MIYDLSSIREESEEQQNQPVKLLRKMSNSRKLIPGLSTSKKVKPFVPEVYSINKQNKSSGQLKTESFANVSFSKVLNMRLNNTLEGKSDFDINRWEVTMEDPVKNYCVYEHKELNDIHKTNKLSNDKIDSFLEISNKFFQKNSSLLNNKQLSSLISTKMLDKVYLPNQRFKLSGIKIKRTITIIGSTESILNFYQSGFNCSENKNPKVMVLKQTNIKVHDPLDLFFVSDHDFVLNTQNSVFQYSNSKVKNEANKSCFLRLSSTEDRKIKDLIISFESSVLQNFDTLIKLDNNVELKTLQIRLSYSKLLGIVKFIDIGNARVDKVKIEIINSFIDTVDEFINLNNPYVKILTLNGYKSEFTNNRNLLFISNMTDDIEGTVKFVDCRFGANRMPLTLNNLSLSIQFYACSFYKNLNELFNFLDCNMIKIQNCLIKENKTDIILSSKDTSVEFSGNIVVECSEDIFFIKGKRNDKSKVVNIISNRFLKNSNIIKYTNQTKHYKIHIEDNSFESEKNPVRLSKMHKSNEIAVISNKFKLLTRKSKIIKKSKTIRVANNKYEFGLKELDSFNNKNEKDLDEGFFGSNSKKDNLVKLFGSEISEIKAK